MRTLCPPALCATWPSKSFREPHGLETDLIVTCGLDLPAFAAFPLFDSADERRVLPTTSRRRHGDAPKYADHVAQTLGGGFAADGRRSGKDQGNDPDADHLMICRRGSSVGAIGAIMTARPRAPGTQGGGLLVRTSGDTPPTEALNARLGSVFRKWPSSTSAARLHKAAGKAWPEYHDEVVATLATRPSAAVLFALHTLKEPEFAWNLAHSLALDSGSTWAELVKVYGEIDPLAVLPIHQRQERQARRQTTGDDAQAQCRVGEVSGGQRPDRRPTRDPSEASALPQEFDRAGLP